MRTHKPNCKTWRKVSSPFSMMLCGCIWCFLHGGASLAQQAWKDRPFVQEHHEAFTLENLPAEARQVTAIATDAHSNVWIATPAGAFVRKPGGNEWRPVFSHIPVQGVSDIACDEKTGVWIAARNNVYRFRHQELQVVEGVESPVSVFCTAAEGVYMIGPKGAWLYTDGQVVKKALPPVRSVRKAVSDGKKGLWIASDVGLYHWTPGGTRHYVKQEELLSAYVKGAAFSAANELWTVGLGGATVYSEGQKIRTVTPVNGMPSAEATCVEASPDGSIWIGTKMGLYRQGPDGTHSLRFSRRWLTDDQVNDIAFDADGTAWIATNNGVSAIKKQEMTLAQKQEYFAGVLRARHIRAPWIVGQCRLRVPGDIGSWEPEDDDNDGEYGGNYLAMESFRYAVTGDPEARENARKSFAFLRFLREVTGKDGFFARTIVPADWTKVHDPNRTYTAEELADELVKEPRFKPVETRWHLSSDKKWLWKGDTSSDEITGHFFGYYFYYKLAADEAEKEHVRQQVASITDHLMRHNYNLTDKDGKPTRWGIWSPDRLNRDPEWMPDRNQNSFEMLAILKLAHYVTGHEKYEKEYLRLINSEKYLENSAGILQQNPAWFVYFDVIMQLYMFPILIGTETDPQRKKFYEELMDKWFEQRRGDESPLINFVYCYTRNKRTELAPSLQFLRDTPLDLIDWTIDHSRREDVRLVRYPSLEDWQVDRLPPASIRQTVRWDRNPWAVSGGSPDKEREPVFWMLPYWIGRYLRMIE